MAFNAGYSLDGPRKAHGLRNMVRVDHLTSQNHLARFYLCLDQCPCIAAEVPIEGEADAKRISWFVNTALDSSVSAKAGD